MDITDDFLIKIAAGVTTTMAIALLYYIGNKVGHISKLLEKHERILFGDSDINAWEGIAKITIANQKYIVSDRRAFIELVSILHRNNIIEINEELKEILDTIKQQ